MPESSGEFAAVDRFSPVAGLDAVTDHARRLRSARDDAERLAIAADVLAAVVAYDDGLEAMAVAMGAKPRRACDNCGSRKDVVFIPDYECSGAHSWYGCRPCRTPGPASLSARKEPTDG